jgi:uncharacterized membrane protein (UPF0127 family)
VSGAHAKSRASGALKFAGWAVVVLAVLALGAFLTVGANGPDDPTLGGIPGFGEVAFRVAPAGGSPPTSAEFCALLAADDTQRAKGLMGRRDLAGFDAMVFRFDQDHTEMFFMRNVPVPLSIAWFDGGGAFVSSTDMPPCPDQSDCPQYSAAGPYRVAVETLQGGLERLGIGPGSRIDVGGPCTG